MLSFYKIILITLLLKCFFEINEAQYTPDWASIDSRPLPSWYDESKFGIFIHWGVFSVPSFGCTEATAGEWYWWNLEQNISCIQEFHDKTYGPSFTYPEFAPMFTADLFNAEQWASLFQQSGAKYVVLTSKHHDGFTNWKSAQSWNWNSVDTGPHQDNVGLVTDAVRNAGLRMGLYHSLFEWYNPLFNQDEANKGDTNIYVETVLKPMLYDIVNTYQPDIIWSDGDWMMNSTYWQSTDFLAWLYNESPVKDSVCVNDRWGSDALCKHGGYYTCQDRYNPSHLINHKWENCLTIDGSSWGFNRNTNISGYLTIQDLLQELVSTVSCGGNLLLNVGPAADGTIHPIFQERLLQLGEWLNINGDSIYSTVPWRAQNDTDANVWYTSSQDGLTVYAIALDWPVDNVLRLTEPVATSSATATFIGYGEVSFNMTDSSMDIYLPYIPISMMPSEYGWVIELVGVK